MQHTFKACVDYCIIDVWKGSGERAIFVPPQAARLSNTFEQDGMESTSALWGKVML